MGVILNKRLQNSSPEFISQSINNPSKILIRCVLFFFAVLRLELRAYTLSYSTSHFL
jgi:hypothetical protein